MQVLVVDGGIDRRMGAARRGHRLNSQPTATASTCRKAGAVVGTDISMNRRTSSFESPLFVIALFDNDTTSGTTVHTFRDPLLWAWMHDDSDVSRTSDETDVPIPGTALRASVTRWDPMLDKAQHLVWLPGRGGECHPSLARVDLGPSDTASFEAGYANLRAEAGPCHCYEGTW